MTATSGKWKEAKDKEIFLPDTDPKIFAIYTHWIYTGEIVPEDDDDEATETTEKGAYFRQLCS
jgi:hypothetical protein